MVIVHVILRIHRETTTNKSRFVTNHRFSTILEPVQNPDDAAIDRLPLATIDPTAMVSSVSEIEQLALGSIQ